MKRVQVLPFQFPQVSEFSYNAKTHEVRLKLDSPLPAQLLDALHGLIGFVDLLRHRQDCAARQVKLDAQAERFRQRCIEVAREYQRLRLTGEKHRAAIRSIFINPTFADLHASTADIAFWVKTYRGGR